MDLEPTIRMLKIELERVAAAIVQLEQLQNANGNGSGTMTNPKSKRGRKSMDSEERRQVSERMKKYWASRPKAR
jgi:hypothetical protein